LVYSPTLEYDFTNWDDPVYVSANPHIARPSLETLVRVLDPRTLVASDWTPVVTLSHLLERWFLGGGPGVAHAGNLLLHLACVGLVWALLRTSGAPLGVVASGALLFALHPLQVESVVWVAGRKTLLATALSLGALLLFVRAPSRGARPWIALGLYVLALGSKGTAVVLPLWLLAWTGLLDRARLRRQLPWIVAMLIFAVARGLWTVWAQEAATRPAAELGLLGRLEIAGPVLLIYLQQLLWPFDLCAHYSWESIGIAGFFAWVFLASLAGGVGWLARADSRLGAFALVAGLALLPTTNLLPAPYFQADRYLYAAMPGLAYVLPALLLRLPGLSGRAAVALLCAGLVALIPVTRARASVWRDARSLWVDTLQCSPAFAAGWNNLGLAEAEAGNTEAALQSLRRAIELDPDYLAAYANEGELLARLGRSRKAEVVLRAGLARGEHPDLLNNLAWLVLESRPDTARTLASRAVELEPRHAAAWDTLGAARYRLNDPEGARRAFERGIALRPDLAELHFHLARALETVGEQEGARRHAARALTLLGEGDAPWAEDARRLAR
jgi:tetratricopeptide (TPR) repeat protein